MPTEPISGKIVDFDPYRSGWQYVSGVVSTDDEDSVTHKQYTAIHLYIMYDNQMNPAILQLLNQMQQSQVQMMQLMQDMEKSGTGREKGIQGTCPDPAGQCAWS